MSRRQRLYEKWLVFVEQARFSRRELIVAIGLSLLALAGGLFSARQSQVHKVVVKKTAKKPVKKTRGHTVKKSKSIFVHVSGAVAEPGLYKLDEGARVAQAIDMAGGVNEDSKPDALNLAAKLFDGQKIYVPAIGDPIEGDEAASNGSNAVGKRININTADAAELEELNGVGPVLAKRIIDWRTRHSRFNSVKQLDAVKGIGPEKLKTMIDQITVE